jgi:hypothetical protein
MLAQNGVVKSLFLQFEHNLCDTGNWHGKNRACLAVATEYLAEGGVFGSGLNAVRAPDRRPTLQPPPSLLEWQPAKRGPDCFQSFHTIPPSFIFSFGRILRTPVGCSNENGNHRRTLLLNRLSEPSRPRVLVSCRS